MAIDITVGASLNGQGLELVGMWIERRKRFLDAMKAAGVVVEETKCDQPSPVKVPCAYFHVQNSPTFREALEKWIESERSHASPPDYR